MNGWRKQIEGYLLQNLAYNGCWNKHFLFREIREVCSIAYMVVLWPIKSALWLVNYRAPRIVITSSFESAISIQQVESKNIPM